MTHYRVAYLIANTTFEYRLVILQWLIYLSHLVTLVRTSSIFSSNWIVTCFNGKFCPQAKNLIQRGCNAVCWFTLHSPNLIKINFAFSLKKQFLFDQCHFIEVFYSTPSDFLTIDEFSGTSCFFRILARPTGYITRCARNLIGVYLTLCSNQAKLRKTLLLCNSN